MRSFVVLVGVLSVALVAACGGSAGDGLQRPAFELPGAIVSFGEASLASQTVETAESKGTWIHLLSHPVTAEKNGDMLVVAQGRAEIQGQTAYAFAVGVGVDGEIAAIQEYLGLFRNDASIPLSLSRMVSVKEGRRTVDLWVWNEAGDPVITEAAVAGLVFEEKD